MSIEVVPRLRLGPADEAAFYKSRGRFVINVLESEPTTPVDRWCPILRSRADDELEADVVPLDKVARLISDQLEAGKRVDLHCGQGIERSPLAAAWFLLRAGRVATLSEAYMYRRARDPRSNAEITGSTGGFEMRPKRLPRKRDPSHPSTMC